MQGYLYLKRLRRQGKSCEQFVSCHAPTQSLLFDVPAWDRFFSAELINTINGFFRRLKRFGVLCHIIRSDGLIWLWSFLITTRWVLYSLILILCLTLACWHHFLLPLRKYNNLREEVGLTLGFFLFLFLVTELLINETHFLITALRITAWNHAFQRNCNRNMNALSVWRVGLVWQCLHVPTFGQCPTATKPQYRQKWCRAL